MKYEVIRPWHGVSVGQVFETDALHFALASHVRVLPDVARGGELAPETPDAAAPKRGRTSKVEPETA